MLMRINSQRYITSQCDGICIFSSASIMNRKNIIVSVTSDLVTDQRAHRTAITFTKQGHRVILVGRKKKDSQHPGSRRYRTRRFKLWFEKGFLFYATYNLRLFMFLLFRKCDVLFSNDLDTLLPNFLVSVLRRKVLIYDSHEYFTGVPELDENEFARKFWKTIERFIFPRLKYVITVNDSIAELYRNEYHVDVKVIRNIPELPLDYETTNREEWMAMLGAGVNNHLIILQGAGINRDRGAEEAVAAMQFVNQCILLIAGDGDVVPQLKEMVNRLHLEGQVKFIGKMPYNKLMKFTRMADIGLTLDKPGNINYKLSLPNKFFDYIHAQVPVLASPVNEIRKIMTQYEIGLMIENFQPEHIAGKINQMLQDTERRKLWKRNLRQAAQDLNWSVEEKKLLDIFHEATL